ncbi:PTS fructose transporter subunit IIA [candidate division WOR-3 bacterium JGI_Cruoil_03_51_56]|uniref:PTS fructose transporter subunit IIA n=1 Tax=candidate division WOR-3 bacterium JGI_Cruoil_03_51_56 TaxID=1973747 RepID=A0A235BWX0_UNCW3|nr:MAG: PTS fructose transporter subunit IIA [candidate division WOR-3 bacterium JGI_Cruoil_03_51_56]
MIKITELLRKETILLEVHAKEKVEVIHELVRPLLDKGTITDEKEFFAAILRRENLESTGIGQGIAIPHARTKAVKKTALALGRSDQGVDFNSLDGNPCHLIFLIAAPEDKKTEYIMTLARISKLLRKDEVRIGLNKAKTREDILNVLTQYE